MNNPNHSHSRSSGSNPSPQSRLVEQNIEQQQLDHTDRLARIETKVDYTEKSMSDIKGEIRETKTDIKLLTSTLDKAIGGVAVMKWIIGIGVVGYIIKEIILPII